MTELEAIKARHAVRSYTDRALEGAVLEQLRQAVEDCNRESGLHLQLCCGEPQAFSGRMARYGKFHGVRNYLALVGKQGPHLDETCGYWGEKLVLLAQRLGLNTCWVALTYSKGKSPVTVGPGEKLVLVVAMGYGETSGGPHKMKSVEALSRAQSPMPNWFRRGVEAAQLAPTAVNQQKFCLELDGTTVHPIPGFGPYTKVDLGIACYHFQVGAGPGSWRWAQ